MPRNIAVYNIATADIGYIKHKMLNWVNRFSIFLYLDSNSYADKYGRYECIAAAGCISEILCSEEDELTSLQQFHDEQKDWLFGNICYDYKNELEPRLHSAHKKYVFFPEFYFFRPQVICYIVAGSATLTIEALDLDPGVIYAQIMAEDPGIAKVDGDIVFEQEYDKGTYLQTIDNLRTHIRDGDCYEINFCNAGHAIAKDIKPLAVFNALNQLSPAPFAAYYRHNEHYMMSASPERYLVKRGDKLLSQPIKGTARRDGDAAKDEQIKQALSESIKDRAENVMITDLVRNDLAHSCDTGSIVVEELFGIYSFPQVHQMISTVSGNLKQGTAFTDALRYSFPMGSMTGAPKVKVMELIEQYEQVKRNLFSGTVGYISPDGDFDFNVIIRSLFYNTTSGLLSYQTGGAITYDSVPEQEWDEMRLKAWALERIFSPA